MKSILKAIGITALVAVIGFSMAACDDGSGPGGGGTPTPQTVTYTGTAGSDTYTLKITENLARYAVQVGDSYELTAGTNKSTGSVTSITGGLTLKPARDGAGTITAKVSGSNLTELTGNSTWDDGTAFTAPGALTSGGNGGGGSGLMAKWYANQTAADAGNATFLLYEFTSDGKILVGGYPTMTYSVTGSIITTSTSGIEMGKSNFSISGTALTLSNHTGNSGLAAGTYYKKAGNNGDGGGNDGGGGTAYTVTYNGNGNTGGTVPTDSNSPYTSGATVTVLGNTGSLVKTGNIFADWNTAADGSSTTYTANATFTISADIVLYAQWIPTGGGNGGGGTTDVEMVSINNGSFWRQVGDAPPSYYQITISAFKMSKYEITQAQWEAVMGTNPSFFRDNADVGETQGNRPVDRVTWYETIVFCNRLSIAKGLSPAYRINGSTNPNDWGSVPTINNDTWNAVVIVPGSNGYRLPTEAQWEYACKAGTYTKWSYGDTADGDYMWYSSNSNDKTHEVGKKLPNPWGLYDMHGNVSEWCWDWHGNYPTSNQTDPTGASSGTQRVIRGGARDSTDLWTTSEQRSNIHPYNNGYFPGFRVALP